MTHYKQLNSELDDSDAAFWFAVFDFVYLLMMVHW